MNREVLKTEAVEFFKKLYKSEPGPDNFQYYSGTFPTLLTDAYELLARRVTNEEIRDAMFDTAPFKAHGVDGIQAFFYQKHWSLVGSALCEMVHKFFTGGNLEGFINRTKIILILKLISLKCGAILDQSVFVM